MDKTTTAKTTIAGKETAKKAAARKPARDASDNGKARELSANDLMLKAWQRMYKNRHKRLD